MNGLSGLVTPANVQVERYSDKIELSCFSFEISYPRCCSDGFFILRLVFYNRQFNASNLTAEHSIIPFCCAESLFQGVKKKCLVLVELK